MLSDKAAETVEKALGAGNARAAIQLLRGLGIMRQTKSGNATDAEEVRRLAEI